jgi:hypothetical protein
MTQFSKMIGGGGEFHTAIKNSLQDFRHGSDYITFHEVFGNIRRQHYVIFASRLANSLRNVDWEKLADFESVEVGETNNPKIEKTIDNEAMQFVVETFGNEWVSNYQTTNPTDIPEEIYRQKVEIMINQAQREIKTPSINWNQLKGELKWKSGKTANDITYEQIKSLANSSHLEHLKPLDHLEPLEPVSEPDSNTIHYYSKTFKGGNVREKEWSSKPSNFSGSTSTSSNVKKTCSDCNKEAPANTNFCQTCGQRLKQESRIQEITDQEAQQIEQQRPFFTKPRGN